MATHKACLAEHHKWTLTTGKPGRDVVPPSPPPLERGGERREHGKADEGEAGAGLQRMADESDSQLRTWRDDRSREGRCHTISHTACAGAASQWRKKKRVGHLSRRACACVVRYAESFFQLDEGATARLRAEVALDGKEGLMLGGSLDLAAVQRTSSSHKTWSSRSSLWWALCGVRSGASSGAEGAGHPEVEMVAHSQAELHNEQVQGH